MPIYEYRCEACGHKLEALQKLSDSPLTDCPVCGKSRLSKLVTAAGFQLKGSGWYATDFKGSGSKPAAKTASGESQPAKSNGGGAEAKAEAKSETKVEAKSDSGGTATGGGGCGGACSCH